MKGVAFSQLNGTSLKIGIAVSRWNKHITGPLVESAKVALRESGVKDENIDLLEVAGAYELPYATRRMIQADNVDVVLAIGCLIKGATMHFEYIASAVSEGLMWLNTATETPVVFGVLTCLTEEQAVARSSGEHNHGYGWGMTAVEMGLLKQSSAKKK